MASIRPFVQSGVIWLVIGLAERKTVLHAHGPEIRRPKVCQTQPGKEASAKAPTEPGKQASVISEIICEWPKALEFGHLLMCSALPDRSGRER